MKVATGTVVQGHVVAEGLGFADGTSVYIVSRDSRERVHLSAEERAELEAGIAEAERGDLIPGDEFLEELRCFG
jgi:predicted transcriptional regulator